MENNTNRPSKGLSTDTSPQDQPKETYRFALNTIMESQDGDLGFVGNEESNEIYVNLPTYYDRDGDTEIPFLIIGKCYIGEEQTALFLVSEDNFYSEIGILNKDNTYETFVNTFTLKFDIKHQIDATFRLRRGCERTVYFTDGLNKPRIFNFDKPQDFQNSGGNWDADKFNLFKTYNKIPKFDSFDIINGGGNTNSGSYNFSIQYLDKDLNPTEWITSSDTIMIYNDNPDAMPYAEVQGSTTVETDYRTFPTTNKSIRLSLSNLDTEYPFYRIAIIVADSGNGIISRVEVTPNISTQSTKYNYTGSGTVTETTVEEINYFNNVIETAGSIEQIENRLVLAETTGKDLNYCKLQKYASKVLSDVITEEITLNVEQSINNPKRGQVNTEKVGYMPGEIYSFGIVYIFEDNTTSPTYHIPGKADDVTPSSMVLDNQLESFQYLEENNNCGLLDYWGYDSQGNPLKGTNVRHHRFPTRAELNKPLFYKTEDSVSETLDGYSLDVFAESEDVTSYYDLNELNNEAGIRFKIIVTITKGDGTTEELESNVESVSLLSYIATESTAVSNYITDVLNTTEGEITSIILHEAKPFAEAKTDDEIFDDVNNYNIITATLEGDVTEEGETFNRFTANSTTSTLDYNFDIYTTEIEIDDTIYKSEIFGIKFSNIEMPSLEDTNGEAIVGYHIVRNERTDAYKTIQDSGIITPIVYSGKFASYSLIGPRDVSISKDTFNLINPEFLFNKKEFSPTQIVKAGEYTTLLAENKKIESYTWQNVQEGQQDLSNTKETDDDGWDLRVIGKYFKPEFKAVDEDFLKKDEIKSITPLNSMAGVELNMKQSDTDEGTKRNLYNAATDNRANIVQGTVIKDYYTQYNPNFPYVYLKAELGNKYSTFKTDPYYKENVNPESVNNSEIEIFNGDTYISSLTYTNSYFYANKLRKRKQKSGGLNIVLGFLSIVGGAALSLISAPAGIALIGFGVSQVATGLEKDKVKKVYEELYKAGLKNAVSDGWTKQSFAGNPKDDEIQWVSSGIMNVFFESAVNFNLRMGNVGFPDFIDSPQAWDKSTWKNHMENKLTVPDSDRAKSGRAYQGFATAETYEINPDYLRRDREKFYFSLPETYDCCSKCQEDFPHRVAYSTQSFQEEQIDNYRVFLPNNYRDIEGETGKITNLFRIQNNLYIQTEEGLWHLPQSFQERITSDIVSFIGTGEFFAVPPRKITDDNNGMSSGTYHKWATIKCPSGVMFVSEKQGTVWLFDGNQLKPISSQGMTSWFKNNLRSKFEENYYNANGVEYPYKNNPSNPIGTGFISTYDSRNERLLLTKKDSILGNTVADSDDYALCYKNNETIVFEDVSQTILDKEATTNDAGNPWQYVGMDESTCQLKFESVGITTMLTERITGFASNSDLHVFYDVGSLSDDTCKFFNTLITKWVDNYKDEEEWTGALYQYYTGSDSEIKTNIELKGTLVDSMPLEDQERWLYYPNFAATQSSNKQMVVVGFVDETNGLSSNTDSYHNSVASVGISNPTTAFNNDKKSFKNLLDPTNPERLTSFAGLIYTPLNAYYKNGDTISSYNARLEFMKHIVASIEGEDLTEDIINNLVPNQNLVNKDQWEGSVTDFKDSLLSVAPTNLTNTNPYTNNLKQYGWDYNLESYQSSTEPDETLVPPNGDEMTTDDFTEDMNVFISNTTEIITEEIEIETIEYDYIDGVVSEETPLENSWTMSYSLKFGTWTSFHSYIPSIYIHTPDRFFSWKVGNNNIWKHNIPNSFQTYYGALAPFIVEYVSLSNPLVTRIWDSLKLYTEAKRFDNNVESNKDERFITFNKLIAYNTRQTTGEINLEVKDTNTDPANYLMQQVSSPNPGSVIIDRNERDWELNDLRDIRVDYNQPIFNETLTARQQDYYIDKVLNISSIDLNKDWTQLESFRDKYLVLRLIFDNFDDVKLILNYSAELEKPSFR